MPTHARTPNPGSYHGNSGRAIKLLISGAEAIISSEGYQKISEGISISPEEKIDASETFMNSTDVMKETSEGISKVHPEV